MNVTRKISPILFGVIAVLVGVSMMGAAISVIVSESPSYTGVAVDDKSITLAAIPDPSLDTLPAIKALEDYPVLANSEITTIGAVYSAGVTTLAHDDLQHVVIVIKIQNTAATVSMKGTDVAVKETTNRTGADDVNSWTPIHMESYGDYVLGYIENDRAGVPYTAEDTWSYYYAITFATPGTYTISWEASGTD